MTERLRVVVADDHPLFRDGIRVVFSASEDLEIVADVGTGAAAVEAAATYQPDVVIMDLGMPDLNGIEATRLIAAASPHIGVLVVTMFDEDESVFAAMRAGARGYLLKGADHQEILHAVRAVGSGGAVFGPALARRLIRYFAARPIHDNRPAPFAELTAREREVLQLMAEGKGNQEIARRLVVNTKTVRNHVSNVFTKLQVADRAQAIIRAREAGLGQTATGP